MSEYHYIDDLYRRYYKFLYIIGSRFLYERSEQISVLEDSIQTVFMQMIKKWNKLETHPNREGWLIVALRRELSSQIGNRRKLSKFLILSLDDDNNSETQNALVDNLHDPEFLCVDLYKEKIATVEKLVGKDNTDLLMQYYVNDVPLSELAKQKNASETALKMKMFRLKEKIRSHPEQFLIVAFFALLLPY